MEDLLDVADFQSADIRDQQGRDLRDVLDCCE